MLLKPKTCFCCLSVAHSYRMQAGLFIFGIRILLSDVCLYTFCFFLFVIWLAARVSVHYDMASSTSGQHCANSEF